jgi:hypothetical protein
LVFIFMFSFHYYFANLIYSITFTVLIIPPKKKNSSQGNFNLRIKHFDHKPEIFSRLGRLFKKSLQSRRFKELLLLIFYFTIYHNKRARTFRLHR